MGRKVNKNFEFPFNNDGLMDWYDGTVNRVIEHDDGKKYYPRDSAKELRKYYEFSEDLKMVGYSRGRSSVKIDFESLKDGQKYPMFISDFNEVVQKVDIKKGLIKNQVWGFVKKGQNYGIYMVENG